MLKYLRLKNFRTCVDTEVEFGPITLLIGRNNTGKSNICQALRFLSACASERFIDSASREAGLAPSEVATRYQPDQPVELEVEAELGTVRYRYRLVLDAAAPTDDFGSLLTVSEESVTAEAGGWTQTLIERNGETTRRLHESADAPTETFSTRTCPAAESALALAASGHAELVHDHVASWRRYCLSPDMLRQRHPADYDAYLKDDGSNLASVLFTLKNEDTRRFEMLLDLVREIEPSIYTFNFIRPRPEEVWMEIEDTEGNRYGPESLSDGTLNYIAMCYVALQSQIVTHRDTKPPGLVCFEEPENGLWVGHLRRLFEVIQEGGKTQQMVLTTHNPYLIDLFEGRLDQVRLVRRGDLGLREGTTVETPDAAKVEAGLEHFSLGEQYFRGLLE